jgi:hypothetical protein
MSMQEQLNQAHQQILQEMINAKTITDNQIMVEKDFKEAIKNEEFQKTVQEAVPFFKTVIQLCCTVGDKNLYEYLLPDTISEYPLIPFHYKWTGTPFPMSAVSPLIGKQREINKSHQLMVHNASLGSSLRYMFYEGSIDADIWEQYSSSPAYRDGILAEYHFMDGYIYGPEYFGKFDDNNNWIPIQVTGVSYGNNGFYFPFSNSSNFGEDFSGNDNDFASNGLAAHDQLTDTPSNNFARYNSIGTSDDRGQTTQANIRNGNLQFNSGGPAYIIGLTIDNHMLDGGKWYFEICLKTSSGFNTTIGFRNADNGDDTPSIEVESDGQIKKDSGNEGSATGGFSDGDIIGIRLDWSNTASRKISFYKNNTIITGQQTFSDSSSIAGFMFYSRESGSGATHHLNTGQNGTFNGNKTAQGNSDGNGIGDFFYSVPTDHLAICSRNLFE